MRSSRKRRRNAIWRRRGICTWYIHELADYLLAEHRLLLELALAQAPAPAAAAVTTTGTADKPRKSKASAKKSALRPDVQAIKPAVIPVKRATPAKATRPALVSSQA